MKHSIWAAWLVAASSLVACGGESKKQSSREPPSPDSTGAGGGLGGSASGGLAGGGVTNGGVAGGGATNGGGAGGLGVPPPGNAREREVLGPLGTGDETIATTLGRELLELGQAVGLAHGYAMCRCGLSPTAVPDDVESFISSCALEESPFGRLRSDEELECALEGARGIQGFDDYVRCRVREVRDKGQEWLAWCSTGVMPVGRATECTDPGGAGDLIQFPCGL